MSTISEGGDTCPFAVKVQRIEKSIAVFAHVASVGSIGKDVLRSSCCLPHVVQMERW